MSHRSRRAGRRLRASQIRTLPKPRPPGAEVRKAGSPRMARALVPKAENVLEVERIRAVEKRAVVGKREKVARGSKVEREEKAVKTNRETPAGVVSLVMGASRGMVEIQKGMLLVGTVQ
jgi:hypothetical protein